ncbi:MAG: hypothetical protein ACLQHF_08530 [Terracidiphilus sp.]
MAYPRAQAAAEVAIHYLESSPVAVRGAASGRMYRFSSALPVQQVESRDVSTMLSSRFFKRA